MGLAARAVLADLSCSSMLLRCVAATRSLWETVIGVVHRRKHTRYGGTRTWRLRGTPALPDSVRPGLSQSVHQRDLLHTDIMVRRGTSRGVTKRFVVLSCCLHSPNRCSERTFRTLSGANGRHHRDAHHVASIEQSRPFLASFQGHEGRPQHEHVSHGCDVGIVAFGAGIDQAFDTVGC